MSEKFQIHTRWSNTQQEIFFKRFPAFLCPFLMVKKKYWLRFPEKVAVGNERQSGSFLEQDSTAVPKFAYRSFCPFGKSCWGVPSPNPAMRLVPLENPTKKYLKNRLQNGGK